MCAWERLGVREHYVRQIRLARCSGRPMRRARLPHIVDTLLYEAHPGSGSVWEDRCVPLSLFRGEEVSVDVLPRLGRQGELNLGRLLGTVPAADQIDTVRSRQMRREFGFHVHPPVVAAVRTGTVRGPQTGYVTQMLLPIWNDQAHLISWLSIELAGVEVDDLPYRGSDAGHLGGARVEAHWSGDERVLGRGRRCGLGGRWGRDKRWWMHRWTYRGWGAARACLSGWAKCTDFLFHSGKSFHLMSILPEIANFLKNHLAAGFLFDRRSFSGYTDLDQMLRLRCPLPRMARAVMAKPVTRRLHPMQPDAGEVRRCRATVT